MPSRAAITVFVSAWCVAAGLAAQGDPAHADAAREAGVLAVLRRLDPLDKQWLANSTFKVLRSPHGVTQVLPHIPISCGNSMQGAFDATRARRLAHELFAVYRLDAKTDVSMLQSGVAA